MKRFEIYYAGNFMGLVDAKTHGWAVRKALARWGGKRDLYSLTLRCGDGLEAELAKGGAR